MFEVIQFILGFLIFAVVVFFSVMSAFMVKPPYIYDDEPDYYPDSEEKEKPAKEVYSPHETINS